MSNSAARNFALQLRDAFEFEPTSLVTYRSAGRIIAIGEADALQKCEELSPDLNLQRVETGGNQVSVEGYLGCFQVGVGDPVDHQIIHSGDIVVDLSENPVLNREMLPPGYLSQSPGDWDSEKLSAELLEMTGEFDKPKFFDYDSSICAHQVHGKIACRQCIDACPAEAIQSIGERVEVDSNLCQGGGSCASVCPSGAIRYLYPQLRDNGDRLRDVLKEYRQHGGEHPVVLFHADSYQPDYYLEAYDNLLPFAVEELGSVGMDLCLSALAYGAMQVVLLVDEQVPASTANNLRSQLDWVHAAIAELGLGSAYVTTVQSDSALPEVDSDNIVEALQLDMPQLKRKAIYQALDHLVAQRQPAARMALLPASAPFGEATIDAGKCTLCMACVGACPGRALQDGSNRAVPEVFFIESNCLQCNACVITCPEDAISLTPRVVFDAETRNRSRVLNSDTPFACIACGKPFAPTSVISKMQDKLKDHHMFGNQRALDRLKMCDDCRVADIVQDPEAMGGQFDPMKNFRQ